MLNTKFWLKHPQLIIPRLRYWFFERFNKDKPWLCPGTIAYLDRTLRRDMVGVEFGSGRSTHWLAARLKSLLSVEHHSEWHATVKKQLSDAELQNVDYRKIALDHDESEPERANYDPVPRYVAVFDEFDDHSIDFVLVDGHYRTTCIKKALQKIRPGGLLLVDDINLWQTEQPPVPDNWKCVDNSTNGIKSAKIWQSPSAA